ncbi:Transmembrane protein [Nymphaea thermarum]|nr:Transmembrane protein [Nymphaea thermarum]
MMKNMEARRRIRYSRLREDESDGEDERDLRFEYTPSSLDRVPWKSVALALFLVSLGSLLLLLSYFIFSGHMPGDPSQAYGLVTLGFLAFLPGFYETRIAYYSWRGANGYRFSSIPGY